MSVCVASVLVFFKKKKLLGVRLGNAAEMSGRYGGVAAISAWLLALQLQIWMRRV